LSGGERYFELTVNGEEIAPRQQIVSVLFALKAQDAQTLSGHPASSFLSTSNDYGRSGVASDLYEGSTKLTDKYLNNDRSEAITANSSTQTLRVENTGSGHGIQSITSTTTDDKAALYGEVTGTSGNTYGVYGITHSPGSSTGTSVGVYGLVVSPTAIGGSTAGVLGRTWSVPVEDAATSVGVFGWGDVPSGRTYGIWGETRSSTDNVSGVMGVNLATSGVTRGVIGNVVSTTPGAAGVLGAAPNNGNNVRGVLGYCHSSTGYAVYSDGNLEVATGYKAVADAWTTRSSKRWKTNIKPIEDARDKIQHLRGVSFDWKADGKHDIGLIAEEVGEVIPEVVAYEENGKDAKSIDYARLVAVLVEAVKEQQEIIDKQNSELTEMKAKMAKFESALQKLEALTGK
jgi:hypothetical protein